MRYFLFFGKLQRFLEFEDLKLVKVTGSYSVSNLKLFIITKRTYFDLEFYNEKFFRKSHLSIIFCLTWILITEKYITLELDQVQRHFELWWLD